MGIFTGLGTAVGAYFGYPQAGAAIGSALDGVMARNDQKDANQQNVELSREQMAFQERMSGSAYQRSVLDMKLAGLNPMLAYSQGGASTPSGSLAHVEPAVALQSSSALQGAQTVQALQSLSTNQAQIAYTQAQTDKVRSETVDQNLNTAARVAEIEQSKSASRNLRAAAANTEQQVLGTIADSARKHAEFEEMNKGGFKADVDRRKAEARLSQLGISAAEAESRFYNSQLGENAPALRAIMDLIKGFTSAASAARR